MLESAGFGVTAETSILFIPGGLRMLDLACHVWCRPLAQVTAALVWPFVLLDRHVTGRAEARIPAGHGRDETGTQGVVTLGRGGQHVRDQLRRLAHT